MRTFYLMGHDSLSPDVGGGTQRLLSIARALRDRGTQVTLIGPSDRKEINGFPVRAILLPRKGPLAFLQIVLFNLKTLKWLYHREQPQPAIVVHNAISALTPAFLHWLRGQPFYLDLTDIHSEYFYICRQPRLSRWIKSLIRRLELSVIGQADYLSVASSAMKHYLRERGISPERMIVVPDGADMQLHDVSKEPGAGRHILHVSHTDYLTQVEVLLRAIPLVLKECPDAIFNFVARGKSVSMMKSFVRHSNLSHAVRWHAPRPRHELKEVYRQASIGLIQRRDMVANHLVVTGKLFDYWASGLAVISSRLRGIQEVAEDRTNILFCDPGSSESLALAIIEVLQNAALREKLALEGAATVQRYALDSLAGQIADAFLKS